MFGRRRFRLATRSSKMGWTDWWSAARVRARIAHARGRLAVGEFNEARLDLEGIETPEAAELRAQALAGLVQKNLLEGAAFYHSGQRDEATDCFARARRWGASQEQVDAARLGPRPQKPRRV